MDGNGRFKIFHTVKQFANWFSEGNIFDQIRRLVGIRLSVNMGPRTTTCDKVGIEVQMSILSNGSSSLACHLIAIPSDAREEHGTTAAKLGKGRNPIANEEQLSILKQGLP